MTPGRANGRGAGSPWMASVRTHAAGEVDVAVAVAVVFPHDVAHAPGTMARDREARAGLLAHARPGIVHPLRRREGRATVGAGGEEDVVVAEAIVLPGDEEVAPVERERRVPLVGRRVVVGVEARLRVVELAVRREVQAAVVAARVED